MEKKLCCVVNARLPKERAKPPSSQLVKRGTEERRHENNSRGEVDLEGSVSYLFNGRCCCSVGEKKKTKAFYNDCDVKTKKKH